MNKFERIKSFLEKSDSDELILLKGHLLIEELLDQIINVNIGEVISKKLNLNFYRKLLLVCGMLKITTDSDLAKQILLINKIRNKLAHNLENDLKLELIGFIKVAYRNNIPKTINRKQTYLNSLKKCFYFILGNLHGMCKVHSMLNTDTTSKSINNSSK